MNEKMKQLGVFASGALIALAAVPLVILASGVVGLAAAAGMIAVFLWCLWRLVVFTTASPASSRASARVKIWRTYLRERAASRRSTP